MLPSRDPATASAAHKRKLAGLAMVSTRSSASVPPGLGMPADSTRARTNRPRGPQETRRSWKPCIYEVGQVPDLPFKWSFAGRSGTCPTLRIGAPQLLQQSGLADYLDAQGCGFVEL